VLLYNHKQEFLGIDDEGLSLLGYPSLESLLSVCLDPADLFANEPGYIHNFKNFSWISFLLHAESDASSAIVHGNGRTFTCTLELHPLYLADTPASSSYRIEMTHVKTLSGEAIKPHIITPKATKAPITPPISNQPRSSLDFSDVTPTILSEPSTLDIPEMTLSPLDTFDTPAADDSYLDVENNPFFQKTAHVPTPQEAPVAPAPKGVSYSAAEKEYFSTHTVNDDYKYDPTIAAGELGLPVDLIEEFIGDFIQQSHDFKEPLYEAVAKNDFNNIHILSHKLKGVAANLRIEDVLETLTIINSSSDMEEVDANLKYYYRLIDKLEGKEIDLLEVAEETAPITEIVESSTLQQEDEDDLYSFGFKQYDDEPLIVQAKDVEIQEEREVAIAPQAVEKILLDIPEASPTAQPLPMLNYNSKLTAGVLGIDLGFMEELLRDYKKDALKISVIIKEAINAFDTATWRANALKLKGISDNLRLIEIADELAIIARANDAQEAKKAHNRLDNYLNQL
jgi:HPt (histidine-containing phosphotransfer) domain-containing protein